MAKPKFKANFEKSFANMTGGVAPKFRMVKVPGQVPDADAMEALRLASAKPPKFTMSRLLVNDNPRLTIASIVDGIGMDNAEQNSWAKYLSEVMDKKTPKVTIQQKLYARMRNERMESAQRQALAQRAASYYNNMMKSESADTLSKAGPYIGPKGGKWADAKHTVPWESSGSSKTVKMRAKLAAMKEKTQVSKEKAGAAQARVSEKKEELRSVQAKTPKGMKLKIAGLQRKIKQTEASTKKIDQDLAREDQKYKKPSVKDLVARGYTEKQAEHIHRNVTDKADTDSWTAARVKSEAHKYPKLSDEMGVKSVEVFRVVPRGVKDITTGDYVFLDKKSAIEFREEYGFIRGQPEIVSMKASSKDFIFPHEDDNGEYELIYTGGKLKKSERFTADLNALSKGGPYIGPRGGKWADPKFTISWKEEKGRGKKLPEDPKRYFVLSKSTKFVDIDKLKPLHKRDSGIARAFQFMQEASEGKIKKRAPLTVSDNGDGTYSILSGNSTYENARKQGWKKLPVVVDKQMPGVIKELQAAINKGAIKGTVGGLVVEAKHVIAIHQKNFSRTMSTLKSVAPKDAEVQGRVKTMDSALGKVLRKPDEYPTPNKLEDVTGMRVITKTIAGVYSTIDKLKEKFEIVEIDDKIKTPAGPMKYRSVHLSVKDTDGQIKELQVRTASQQKLADWTHDVYKPLTSEQEALLEKNQSDLNAYAAKLSDHLLSKDKGEDPPDPPQPPCPSYAKKTFGCPDV